MCVMQNVFDVKSLVNWDINRNLEKQLNSHTLYEHNKEMSVLLKDNNNEFENAVINANCTQINSYGTKKSNVNKIGNLMNIDAYSCLKKLLQVTSWILRFTSNIRSGENMIKNMSEFISNDERQNAFKL